MGMKWIILLILTLIVIAESTWLIASGGLNPTLLILLGVLFMFLVTYSEEFRSEHTTKEWNKIHTRLVLEINQALIVIAIVFVLLIMFN